VLRTALFWLDPAARSLTCVATAGGGRGEGWLGQVLAAGLGMAGRAVTEGAPVWTADLLVDPRVPIAPWLRERMVEEGLRAVAAAPVRTGAGIAGALGFLDGPGRAYDGEGLATLGRLADALGATLEESR
jgi:GAF domain-containing protein